MKKILTALSAIVLVGSITPTVVACDSASDISKCEIEPKGKPFNVEIGYYSKLADIALIVQQEFAINNYATLGDVDYSFFQTEFFKDEEGRTIINDNGLSRLKLNDTFYATILPKLGTDLVGKTKPQPLMIVNSTIVKLNQMSFARPHFAVHSMEFNQLYNLQKELGDNFYLQNERAFNLSNGIVTYNNFSTHVDIVLYKLSVGGDVIKFDDTGSAYLDSLNAGQEFYVSFTAHQDDMAVSGTTERFSALVQ